MRIQLKSTLLLAIGIFALTAAFTLNSCKADRCKAVVCANGGACQADGSCDCKIGYEGERCETISKDKFKGVWQVVESGTASRPAHYAVSIEDGDAIDQVLIRNFYNKYNGELTAYVKNDTLTIPLQTMRVGDEELKIRGVGYADPEAFYALHGKMILRYMVTYQNGTEDKFGINGTKNVSTWTKN